MAQRLAGQPARRLRQRRQPADQRPASLFGASAGCHADSPLSHSATSHLLLMHGTDHMQPQPATTAALAYANQHQSEDSLIQSTLPNYFAALQSTIENSNIQHPKSKIPTVSGELRSPQRHHLLPGALSSRVWIKQRDHHCETLLEKWAEPFSAFAAILEKQAERNEMQSKPANAPSTTPAPPRATCCATPLPSCATPGVCSMECHPHDSICGCSIDQVHDEMRPRFDQVEQIADEITRQSLEYLAAQVDTLSPSSPGAAPRVALVVFNPHMVPVTGDHKSQPTRFQPDPLHLKSATRRARCFLARSKQPTFAMSPAWSSTAKGLFSLLSGVTDGQSYWTAHPRPGHPGPPPGAVKRGPAHDVVLSERGEA